MSEPQQQQSAGRTPTANECGESPNGARDGCREPSPEPGPRPQPGFEPGPGAAVDSNYEHPAPAGARTSVPGVGIVDPGFGAVGRPPGADEPAAPRRKRPPRRTFRPARRSRPRPLLAPGAKHADTTYSPGGGQVAPAPNGAGTPGLADPNFSAAHRPHGSDANVGKTRFVAADAGPARPRQGGETGQGGEPRQVRDVMTADVECCTPETQLYYVAHMMADRDVGAIPVVQSTDTMKPVGVVTDRDIVVRVIAKNQDPYALTASAVMSTGLVKVTPDVTLEQCASRMEAGRVRRALVLDPAGRCCGIIALADVARLAPPAQAAELVRDLSQPGGEDSEVSSARYH